MTAAHDIGGREDLELLLRSFYGRALRDPLLGHVFVDVARMDLEKHLPVITDFWQKVLFNTGTYSGRAMEVHRRISRREPLTAEHFERWLSLWQAAVEEGFRGPVAEQALAHAQRVARTFLRELGREQPTALELPIVPIG